MDKIEKEVYSFKTKYEEGFIRSEIKELLKYYPTITLRKFNKQLGVVTGMLKNGEQIIYHTDILTALLCLTENRGKRLYEFD